MIATLPSIAPTTALNEDPSAESRDWDLSYDEAASMLQTASLTPGPLEAIPLDLDGRVRQLISGEYDDGPDELMADLQTNLRHGNRRLADQLTSVVRSEQYDAEVRSLALETLVAARARATEWQAAEAVRVALEAPYPQLQFAGVAALSDLSRRHQIALTRVIREIVSSPTASASVKRAGAAFLRRRV